ncbi:MAG: hypothetical protein JSR19_09380 [Proteobacteria bacterium]|nr:hypothetical protein [Pseudomonadota bacterium]HQR04136.1 hypothetical protein [Rhodocyclaceae bacterium]
MRKLLEELWSFFALAMMLIGITGLIFHILKKDGLFERLADKVVDAELTSPLMATPVILGALWLGWACLSGRLVVGRQHPFWNIVTFALICAGIYFAHEWFTTSAG